jgi:hypothetical protein
MHPVRLLLDFLPVLLVEPDKFQLPFPLQAYLLADSRHQDCRASASLDDPFSVFRCGIMNCVNVCRRPEPTKAIGHVRNMLLKAAWFSCCNRCTVDATAQASTAP